MTTEEISHVSQPPSLQSVLHPLDPLTAAEIILVSNLVKSLPQNAGKTLHFKRIEITEPPKAALRKFLQAERCGSGIFSRLPRKACALWYHVGTADLFTAAVDLDLAQVTNVELLDGRYHAQADADEIIHIRNACLLHPAVLERVEKFHLPQNTKVICDTWPYGRDDDALGPRLVQCYLFARRPGADNPAANHYDNPLPISPIFNLATGELVDIQQLPTGTDATLDPEKTFIAHEAREYHHDLQTAPMRTDLKPLFVRQPQGPSFTIQGHLVIWQKWRFRLGFNWREGMVLHDVTYDGREIFHRLSLSEMFVPYGDPRAPYSRKSVFDVGDIGAGVAANNLALGCDCLGLIRYFSFVISNSAGNAVEKPNAVCMHEIDDGIGWKHTNTSTGAVSITRSRVLVLQSIITVGNYEYIFLWHFDQAAGLHYKIQATGILSTALIDHGIQVPFGTIVNDGVMAPFHQHLFSLRIDPCIDGDSNTLIEEDSIAMPWDSANPSGTGYVTQKRALTTSTHSDFALNRVHKIINMSKVNPTSGHPVAYAIHSPPKQMLLANPESWHGKRARYAYHPFWVTKHNDQELYSAGDFTYQSLPQDAPHPSGDLATWANRGDKTEQEDIVVWHSISLTHNPRPEDYPVMPCDTMTVSLKPSGFFEYNPALDVPQSTQGVNQSVLVNDSCGIGVVACHKV